MKETEITNAPQKTNVTQKTTPVTGGTKEQKKQEVRGLGYEDGRKVLSTAPEATPKPAALGSALVLSRDPGMSSSAAVSWFRDLIGNKASAWGLAFDKKNVRLASDPGGATVVALDWPAGLGSAPQTPVMPDTNLNPVDARLAMAAVPKLPGWAKMPAADQGILTALLEGETNAVSAATRDSLRPKFLDLQKKPEAEQATALSATIGHKDATPGLVSETVETEPATLALAGPEVKANYEFRGTKADAHVYTATYGDGTTLEVVAPKAPDPAYHQYTVNQAAEGARYLPTNMRKVLKRIVLNPVTNPEDPYWATQYNMPDFHSFMTAGADGQITIYPTETAKGKQPEEKYMRGSMIHESGHSWSYQKWGTDTTKGKWADWQKAMDSDRVSVSNYAKADIAEDVAETVQVYGSTKGKPKYEEYKKIIPARIKILEQEIG